MARWAMLQRFHRIINQWCIALSKVINNSDFVITVKAIKENIISSVISSVSEAQPRLKPVASALPNQPVTSALPNQTSNYHNQLNNSFTSFGPLSLESTKMNSSLIIYLQQTVVLQRNPS